MPAMVRFREFWGERKRQDLDAALQEQSGSPAYFELSPTAAMSYSFRPVERHAGYGSWAPLSGLSASPDWSGALEMRKGALIAFSREELEFRIRRYADPTTPFAVLVAERIGPVFNAARFDALQARTNLIGAGGFDAGTIRRIALSPFDSRWCFHSDIRPLWNEPRPEVAAQHAAGAAFLVSRARSRQPEEGYPVFFTRALPGYHLLDPNSHPFPDVLHPVSAGALAPAANVPPRPNLSSNLLAWTAGLGLSSDADTSRLVWNHVLAVTYSPAYLAENAAAIRQGWPRVPLPGDADLLRQSAALGVRLAELLDADTPVFGVTTGTVAPVLAVVAVPATRPGATRDWRLAGWGHRSDRGVTMPGRGEMTSRAYAAGEEATAAEAAQLGTRTLDVAMNGAGFWRNIPEAVWEVHIGGYQVLKKWLSYRDVSIIGRPLTADEVAHVQSVARRLAAILLMGPELDASFRACAAAHRPLVQDQGAEGPGN